MDSWEGSAARAFALIVAQHWDDLISRRSEVLQLRESKIDTNRLTSVESVVYSAIGLRSGPKQDVTALASPPDVWRVAATKSGRCCRRDVRSDVARLQIQIQQVSQ
jgi:hypothetical protein